MIFVNEEKMDFKCFPDGTSSFRFDPIPAERQTGFTYNIKWLYDDDKECILLWYIVKHIRTYSDAEIFLYLPYIPNARMDRVKGVDEVFTLKWFAEFINELRFDLVFVNDPHSNVATALINKVVICGVKKYIKGVRSILGDKTSVLYCYPDEGAAKRYSEQLEGEYVFCIKHRDWRTGKIERLELTNPDAVKGRDVLIIDDICSRGGTFTFTAKALKEAGAKDIYLWVTHCENTIEKGTVLTDGLISRVFTTDSIYRGSHEKITIIQ